MASVRESLATWFEVWQGGDLKEKEDEPYEVMEAGTKSKAWRYNWRTTREQRHVVKTAQLRGLCEATNRASSTNT